MQKKKLEEKGENLVSKIKDLLEIFTIGVQQFLKCFFNIKYCTYWILIVFAFISQQSITNCNIIHKSN